jgi:diguanylate cyclase (GGDEF)-like protein
MRTNRGVFTPETAFKVWAATESAFTQTVAEHPLLAQDEPLRRLARVSAIVAAIVLGEREQNAREREAELRKRAETDTFTGLANRYGFDKRLAQAVLNAEGTGLPVGLVYLDHNNIDVVNEIHGKEEGDRWIKTTATILQDSSPFASRWGGDEFSTIHEQSSADDLTDWWQGVSQAHIAAGIQIGAGAALYFPGISSLESTLATADSALYDAKLESKRIGRPVLHIAG